MDKNSLAHGKAEGWENPPNVWATEKGGMCSLNSRHHCSTAPEVTSACSCLPSAPLPDGGFPLGKAEVVYQVPADAGSWRKQKEKIWHSVMEMTGQNGPQ